MSEDAPQGWDRLKPEVSGRIRPFIEEVAAVHGEHLVSAAVTGSAVIEGPDHDPVSVGSVLVFDELALGYVESVAPLGKKYGRRGVAVPLVMSEKYIEESRDVFALEFLNLRLAHVTVLGKEVFRDLAIPRADLRTQCERELKSFLIRLRQGYLSSAGDGVALEQVVREASASFFSIVRGVLCLLDTQITLDEKADAEALREKLKLNAEPVYGRMLLADVRTRPKEDFEKFYAFAEGLAAGVNGLKIE